MKKKLKIQKKKNEMDPKLADQVRLRPNMFSETHDLNKLTDFMRNKIYN